MELGIILMMLLIIVAVAAMKLNEPGIAFPFKKKGNLFTPVERTFLALIDDAVGKDYRILCRVRMNDILSIRQSTNKKTSISATTRASSKHLDFVLCSKQDMSPVMAIDLVHMKGKDGYKSQRDYFVSGALDAANIPHVRIKVRSGYTAAQIRECIHAKLPKPQLKQLSPPASQGKSALTNELTGQPKPTRPIRTNKTVPRNPVVPA
ncbi:DUF2726 domain-containing protein [Paraglaciecola sp. 2405UD69-4]|uniref:DUF2726 domain-containing protein n=1 Tax=Paraglaciecola sp. 2405UD69-4 TaxID=3391836 RepID=UPI0039C926E4